MTNSPGEFVVITGTIRQRTEKAVLMSDGTREVWLPMSQIKIQGVASPTRQKLYDFRIPEWMAIAKGLV